jgi:hypothetical protein
MTESLRLVVTTEPAALPLTLSQIKAYLGIDESEVGFDPLLMAYQRTAVGLCEAFTKRALITQTLTMFRDAWGDGGAYDESIAEGWTDGAYLPAAAARYVELPRPPLQSVIYVKTYDDLDVAITWAAASYFVDTASKPGRILPRVGQAWPTVTRVANGVEIRYVAGYGDSGDRVPPAIRDGLLAFIAKMHDCGGREDAQEAARNCGAYLLWQPYRIMGLT